MSKMWKTITTSLNDIVDKHCNYTTRIMNLILNIDSIEHTSYKNKAKLLQKEWKLNIHRSTAYLHKKNKYSQYS